MILCHKCAGILARRKDEDATDMMRCGCISGYVRGFEPNLSRKEAIQKQIEACKQRAALYAGQGRPGFCNMDEQAAELERLLAAE